MSIRKGRTGEEVAARILESLGYRVVETNFLSKYGEIDIVAHKGETVHFVEVKSTYGPYNPAENFHRTKLKRFIKTVQVYCFMNNIMQDRIQVDLALVDLQNRVFNLVERADTYFD